MSQKDNKADTHQSAEHLKYYPVCLDVAGKSCLVVGGGSVGARKSLTLAKCGARVSVVSSAFSDEFINKTSEFMNKTNKFASKTDKIINKIDVCNPENHTILCIKKSYDSNDLDNKFLVIGATNNMTLNRKIARDAHDRNILCNIADFPEGSSFVLPSIVQRGDLVITVSTSGNSPALAKKLRKDLELQFGEEYTTFLMIMGNIRKRLLAQNHSPEAHASIFRKLVYSDLLDRIAVGDNAGIEIILQNILGSNLVSDLISDLSNEFEYQDLISGE
ncbi:MAG: bifunctional precorrin-2 dehydrogenase/sirohydrochlorin ferrochelatase [Desulfamplus sp.]|nr:bifunctional precorrin-2 dehydrogenase/sirohydrochlorin ferrochelatase [Desulfamplus sp.]